MSINVSAFLLLFLATATLLLSTEANAAANVNSKDLCSATDYKPLCRAVVKGITNPVAATEAAIKHAIVKTQNAYSRSKMMGKSENVEICKEVYDDAITDLVTSLKNLKQKDKGSLNSNLSSAVGFYSSCEDAYVETGETSPFAKTNELLEHLVDNCLVLASQIH